MATTPNEPSAKHRARTKDTAYRTAEAWSQLYLAVALAQWSDDPTIRHAFNSVTLTVQLTPEAMSDIAHAIRIICAATHGSEQSNA